MKRYQNIDIYCAPALNFLLGLSGTRENYGHDDSLPFQADIMVLDLGAGDKEFRKIGVVSNGGFGGPCEVHCFLDPPAGIKADTLCKNHQMMHCGQAIGPYNLGDACETMAGLFIDAQNAYPERVKRQNLLFRFDDDPVNLKNKPKVPLYWA